MYSRIKISKIVKEAINKNKKDYETIDDYLMRVFRLEHSDLGSTGAKRKIYKLSEMKIGDIKIFPIYNWNSPDHARIVFAIKRAMKGNSRMFQLNWIDDGCSITRIE